MEPVSIDLSLYKDMVRKPEGMYATNPDFMKDLIAHLTQCHGVELPEIAGISHPA